MEVSAGGIEWLYSHVTTTSEERHPDAVPAEHHVMAAEQHGARGCERQTELQQPRQPPRQVLRGEQLPAPDLGPEQRAEEQRAEDVQRPEPLLIRPKLGWSGIQELDLVLDMREAVAVAVIQRDVPRPRTQVLLDRPHERELVPALVALALAEGVQPVGLGVGAAPLPAHGDAAVAGDVPVDVAAVLRVVGVHHVPLAALDVRPEPLLRAVPNAQVRLKAAGAAGSGSD